jgi:uncharacterized OsmC-like protein
MTSQQSYFFEAVNLGAKDNMSERQEPLSTLYQGRPEDAHIIDRARTSSSRVSATTPLYGEVVIGDSEPKPYALGVHQAVGGRSDFPNPGEILSGALAACLDSTIRIISNRLGIRLSSLSVSVVAHVDVRGTLMIDKDVPVGFQNIDVSVDIETEEDVPESLMSALLNAAENSCVILQTIRNLPEVSIESHVATNTTKIA